jgi:hypothetical protein
MVNEPQHELHFDASGPFVILSLEPPHPFEFLAVETEDGSLVANPRKKTLGGVATTGWKRCVVVLRGSRVSAHNLRH